MDEVNENDHLVSNRGTASVKTAVRAAVIGRRRNMRAPEREQDIIEKAVGFFAEHGFGGQTRELAKRIGITHSAIYRHFPTKEALIERVYEHVFLSRWRPGWETLVTDRSRSLEDRLTQFYGQYADQVFDYDWVRIFVSSGLKSYDLTSRYLALVSDRIIHPVAEELRFELGLPSTAVVPASEREIELVWGLHGRVFYMAIRKFIYGTPIPQDLEPIIGDAVRLFIGGATPIVRELTSSQLSESPPLTVD